VILIYFLPIGRSQIWPVGISAAVRPPDEGRAAAACAKREGALPFTVLGWKDTFAFCSWAPAENTLAPGFALVTTLFTGARYVARAAAVAATLIEGAGLRIGSCVEPARETRCC
jgi:hypothetical protein